MSQRVRLKTKTSPKDVSRREFKQMVDALFRRFMLEFSHAVPDTAAGKATMLKLFAVHLNAHAAQAPAEETT